MIGLPGETVWAKGGHVWIKDKGKPAFQLHEPYTHGKPTNDLPRETIPPGLLPACSATTASISDDSRIWGLEPRGGMIGIARVRYWPLGRIGLL